MAYLDGVDVILTCPEDVDAAIELGLEDYIRQAGLYAYVRFKDEDEAEKVVDQINCS